MALRTYDPGFLMTDEFLTLRDAEKAMYFELLSVADNYGVIENPALYCRIFNGSADTLDRLDNAGLIFKFDDGCVLIRHWKRHNKMSKEKSSASARMSDMDLVEADRNGVYQWKVAEQTPAQEEPMPSEPPKHPDGKDDLGIEWKNGVPKLPYNDEKLLASFYQQNDGLTWSEALAKAKSEIVEHNKKADGVESGEELPWE